MTVNQVPMLGVLMMPKDFVSCVSVCNVVFATFGEKESSLMLPNTPFSFALFYSI